MPKQTYKNHRRFVGTWHILTAIGILALLAGSSYYLYQTYTKDSYPAVLFLLTGLILVSIFLHARQFALKAQDRAIRAEENLRHFVLTGRVLDKRLRTSQIIALRFAADEEFVALATEAAEKKMRSQDIKKSISKWKPDINRV
ncbi:MAG: hypothetical protein H7Y31_10495 [Chitinophagaceae bacterium]|nr:hypothetical protein [Chitinophagaceae bacterium]